MKFSKIILQLRKEKEISQHELALHLGVSQSAVAKWELDKTEPTASALLKMASFFDVSVDYLLGIEDELGNKM